MAQSTRTAKENDQPGEIAELYSRIDDLTTRLEALESRPNASGNVNDEVAFKVNWLYQRFYFNETAIVDDAWKAKQAENDASARESGNS